MIINSGRRKYMFLSILFIIVLAIFLNEIFNLNDRYRLFVNSTNADVGAKWTGILWPSIGNPEFVEKKDSDEIEIVSFIAYHDEVRIDDIIGVLHPVHADGSTSSIRLQTMRVESIDLASADEIGRWSDWVIKNTPSVYKVLFTFSRRDLAKEKNTLCDLEVNIGTSRFLKRNAVFYAERLGKKLRVMLASDIHVATRWDEIEENVERLIHAKTSMKDTHDAGEDHFNYNDLFTSDVFNRNYVNPNRMFSIFIKKANELYDKDEIDVMVLAGDLVDYKYKYIRALSGNRYEDTEWKLLEQIILGEYKHSERLRVPVFMTTGNHDYRLYPYSLQVYGLRHCGIPDDFTNEYLRKNGEYRTGKYRLSDLDSIRINTGRDHSLNYYYRFFNPLDDFSRSLGGAQQIFLDTGSDALCHLENFISSRGLLFIKGLAAAVEHPASNGIDQRQLQYLMSRLNSTDAHDPVAIYCHSPFFNNDPGTIYFDKPDVEEPLPVKVNIAETIAENSDMDFENAVAEAKLNISTLFQNRLPILTNMIRRSGQTVIFSGHVHHAVEYGIDKKDGQLLHSKYSESGCLSEILKSRLLLLQGPAVGHIERSYREGSVPIYRILTFNGGSLKSVSNIPVTSRPFSEVYAQLRIERSATLRKRK